MDEPETKTCENCKREIPIGNYTIHSAHCSRNIKMCPVCKEPIPLTDLDEHHEKMHTLKPCKKCGDNVCGTDLEDHVRDSCSHTVQSCRFCSLELPRRELPAHEAYCGVRTEHCADCGEWVMARYRQLHLDSNHGFLRLDDDPEPRPRIDLPRRPELMNMGILHAPVNIPINIQYGNGNDEPENFLNPNDIRIMNAIANVEAIAADNLRLARAVSEAEARIAANNANAEAPPANAEPQPVVAEPRRIISVGPLPSPYRRVNYVDSAVPRGERYTEEVRRPSRGRAANRARAGDAAEPFMSSCSTRDIIAVSSNTAGPSNAPSISNTAGPSNVAEMSSTAGPSTSAGVSNPPGPSNVAEPQKLAKRTNEQPQINANAEPQKCEASKKP
ncbi:hypothetical protein ACJJTC_019293 [Scirpophaga incertulas]